MSTIFFREFKYFALASVVALALGVSNAANAQTPGYIFTGPTETTGNGGNFVFGNNFTANTSVLVTQLGYAAPGGITGQSGVGFFSESHTVGIYNSAGTLLTSIVLTPGVGTNATTVISGFRYAALSSAITLTAGQTYTVAGTTGSVDPYAGYATAATDPSLTNHGGRIANSSTLVNPLTSFEAPNGGTAGPNLLVSPAIASSAPEPAACVLLMAGLPIIGLVRRRYMGAK